jgi:hypothetical protein
MLICEYTTKGEDGLLAPIIQKVVDHPHPLSCHGLGGVEMDEM